MADPSDLYFAQQPVGEMANLAYLIGSRAQRKAYVVDPAWNVQGLLDQAAKLLDVRDDRNVGPRRDRPAACRAARARPDDRLAAGQPLDHHVEEAADHRAQHGAEADPGAEGHLNQRGSR